MGLFGLLYGLFIGGTAVTKGFKDGMDNLDSRKASEKKGDITYYDNQGTLRFVHNNRIAMRAVDENHMWCYMDAKTGETVEVIGPDDYRRKQETRTRLDSSALQREREYKAKAIKKGELFYLGCVIEDHVRGRMWDHKTVWKRTIDDYVVSVYEEGAGKKSFSDPTSWLWLGCKHYIYYNEEEILNKINLNNQRIEDEWTQEYFHKTEDELREHAIRIKAPLKKEDLEIDPNSCLWIGSELWKGFYTEEIIEGRIKWNNDSLKQKYIQDKMGMTEEELREYAIKIGAPLTREDFKL